MPSLGTLQRLRPGLCADPPAEDFLHAAYSDADFDSGPEALAAAQTYADALRVHLPGLARRNAAVDVGAGSGPLLPFLQEQGFFR